MIRKILLLASLCALAAVGLASSASAATFIRSGSTTGPTYTGSISAAQIGTSTLTATDGSGVTVSCPSGTVTGSVGGSGGASVTGTISALTFGTSNDCSSNTSPQINSCTLGSASGVSATADPSIAGTGTFTIGSISVNCKNQFFGTICVFNGSNITGHISDTGAAGSDITFTNAGPVTSSSFGCPTSAHFTGTFGPILGSGGVKLYINHV